MRKPMKRLLSLALALSMALCLLPAAVSAEGGVYVALGDSITTGYKPVDDQGNNRLDNPFTKQVAAANALVLDDSLAEDGLTSADLLETLTAIAENPLTNPAMAMKLSKAEVITITIGGNDLMGALYGYLAIQYMEEHPEVGVTADQIKEKILAGDAEFLDFASSHLSGFAASSEAQAAIASFAANLTKIVVGLKQANPSAKVVIATQYNPYTYLCQLAEQYKSMLEMMGYGKYYTMIQNLYAAFEVGVTAVNSAINQVYTAYPLFTVADVYTAFKNETTLQNNLCNANVSIAGSVTLNLDFHPNEAGHTLIAGTVNAALSAYTVEYYLLTTEVMGTSVPKAVKAGETVPLAAIPVEGMHFTGWTVTGVEIADPSQSNLSFVMPAGNVTAAANYAAHTPEADDGDCTTAVKCSVCGEILTPAYDSHDLIHHEAQAPTQTSVGWEAYDTCSRCDYTTYKELPKLPTYTIVEGDGQSLTADSGADLTVKASGDAAQLKSVLVDNVTVDPANYTVESGSTIVTLKAAYLATLSNGGHMMTFVYQDGGTATATFTLTAAPASSSSSSSSASSISSSSASSSSSSSASSSASSAASSSASATSSLPQTGDNSSIALWVILLLLAISAMAGTALYISKKHSKNNN